MIFTQNNWVYVMPMCKGRERWETFSLVFSKKMFSQVLVH